MSTHWLLILALLSVAYALGAVSWSQARTEPVVCAPSCYSCHQVYHGPEVNVGVVAVARRP